MLILVGNEIVSITSLCLYNPHVVHLFHTFLLNLINWKYDVHSFYRIYSWKFHDGIRLFPAFGLTSVGDKNFRSIANSWKVLEFPNFRGLASRQSPFCEIHPINSEGRHVSKRVTRFMMVWNHSRCFSFLNKITDSRELLKPRSFDMCPLIMHNNILIILSYLLFRPFSFNCPSTLIPLQLSFPGQSFSFQRINRESRYLIDLWIISALWLWEIIYLSPGKPLYLMFHGKCY